MGFDDDIADPSLAVNKRIQLEYFNRFLSRVFSEDDNSEWVLKGGTGLLARVPSTRATRDIDLYRCGFTLAQALDDLTRLAKIDLGDHFRFEYVGHVGSIGNDTQPHTEGYKVRFNVFIGLSAKETLQVDLAVGTGITGEVTRTEPANALDLPRLVSHPYRLYPVVDQVADKVCATITEYASIRSRMPPTPALGDARPRATIARSVYDCHNLSLLCRYLDSDDADVRGRTPHRATD